MQGYQDSCIGHILKTPPNPTQSLYLAERIGHLTTTAQSQKQDPQAQPLLADQNIPLSPKHRLTPAKPDNVIRSGVSQDEWAWNADEMAHALNQTTGVKAIGDCEDMAFLCGTIYEGAGFDAAIVDAPDHVALLIWLPEFSNANNYWDLPNDNRDAGWIWVEATGSSNPLGWTPPDFENGGWTAYSIGTLELVAEPQPSQSTSTSINLDGGLVTIIIIVFSIILALTRIRRR